jgi:hypothetical protein
MVGRASWIPLDRLTSVAPRVTVVKPGRVYWFIAPLRCLATHPATTTYQMTQSLLFSLNAEAPIVRPIYAGDSVWGCDWGSGYFHVWRDGNYIKLLPQDFALLKFGAAGDVVVIENAHMQPKKKSLAQVFEHQQLVQIKQTADQKGVSIRLWFHSQTPKWRAALNMGDKSDEVDAETIARIIERRGIEDLQYFNPRESYPPRIEWAHRQVVDMNETLNIARFDYLADTVPCCA